MTTQTNALNEDDQNTQSGNEVVNGATNQLGNEGTALALAMPPSMNASSGPAPQEGASAEPAPGPATGQGGAAIPPDNMVLDFRHYPSAEEGEYVFSDTSVALHRNHPTRYGIRNQVSVTFHLELPTGILPLEQKYIASSSKDSQFNRIVTQMIGKPVGKTFDCGVLVRRTGKLRVVHNTNAEGDTFANVEQIWDCVPKGQ